jgi:hypothetical protein
MDFWKVTSDDTRMRGNRILTFIKALLLGRLGFHSGCGGGKRLMHKRISLRCAERVIYLAPAALSLGKVLKNILRILLLTGRNWL